MHFEPEDENAYLTRRDELVEQFAGWLADHAVDGNPSDAELLLDWRWGYGDGELDRWRISDVAEFLFEWCPGKLSAPADLCAGVPGGVAAFVEFLAHCGLRRGGDSPSAIRHYCEKGTAKFVREMGNPANYGMAKSLFGSVGGLDTDADLSPDGISALMERLPDRVALPGDLGDLDDPGDAEPVRIGPVRAPSHADRLASASAAPILVAMRTLADYCAAPGRTLTAKGNLRLADARHLVDALGTGDDPKLGGYRKLATAEDLPGLSWTIELALSAGVVRRHRGKLLAVARFAGLDDVEAHRTLALTALEGDIPRHPVGFFSFLEPLADYIESAVLVHLAALLPDDGRISDLASNVSDAAADEFPGLLEFLGPVSDRVDAALDRLVELGIIGLHDVESSPCPDCACSHRTEGRVTLTASGIEVVLELARRHGLEVVEWPDPALAAAEDMVGLFGRVDEAEWKRELDAWFAARPDPVAATVELVAAVTAEKQPAIAVIAGLEAVGRLGGDGAVTAIRAELGGRWDGLVLNWLFNHDALDLDGIEPHRFLGGLVDVLGAGLDVGGPAELAGVFDDTPADRRRELFDSIWRLEHPRVVDVLDALGSAHPDKVTAKAARKALAKHRSMLAERRGRNAGTPAVDGRAGLPSRS